ncbi:MAG: cytidylate kinase [Desulfobulbus propionicus]|nr:MAG: cytidylate kinase [Desulfobulbus propionicus]
MVELLEIVTIDGPAGSGKSTISKQLAASLQYTYLDTGAMYRAVAYCCHTALIDPEETEAVAFLLKDIEIQLQPPPEGFGDVLVLVNGKSVGELIRTSEMGMLASRVSAQAPVRKYLTGLQQQMGAAGNVVAEGRDTGTVVFPGAAWKFYLDARPEVRMERRADQLRNQGHAVNEQELLDQIVQRDKDDSERVLAPLMQAEDAVYIDSTELNVEEVLKQMVSWIKSNPVT